MNQTRNIIKETLKDFVEEKSNSIEFLIEELVNELNFHKKFLSAHIQLKEDFVNKLTYLEKYQKNLIEGLHGDSSIILEAYSQNFNKRVISESIFNFESEIDRFNQFIVSSTLFKSGLLSEQFYNPIDLARSAYNTASQGAQYVYDKGKQVAQTAYNTGKQVAQTAYNTGKQAVQYVGKQASVAYDKAKESLNNAVNYIKKYGISQIMEGLRSALMSGVGTAIQVALSFTGVGAIVNDVAWGIMTLYDGYQYFVNGASLFNLIIDVICLVTAGTLGKFLGKWVGQAAGSVSEAFTKLLNSGAGSWLKPIVSKLAAAGSWIMGYLGKAASFMAEKMGINWVKNIVGKVGSFFSEMLKIVEQKVAPVVGKVIGKGAEKIAGAQFVAKYGGSMSKKLATLGAAEIEAYTAKGIRNGTLDVIDKKLKELKDSTYDQILSFIDKNYGTQYADLYTEVNNLKKLSKAKNNIATKVGDITSGENIAGATYIATDKTGKVQSYADKAKAAHERLAL
jgi:hypothetical protein